MMDDMTASLKSLKAQIETTPFLVDLSKTSLYIDNVVQSYKRVRRHLNSALEASQEIDAFLKRLGRRPTVDEEA